MWYNSGTMSDQNKEFPSFLGQESKPSTETNEPVEDGVIIEQPLSSEERTEIEHQIVEQVSQVSPEIPTQEIITPAEQPLAMNPMVTEQTDHVEKHLSADNQLNDSGDAHEMLNDLLQGNYKP